MDAVHNFEAMYSRDINDIVRQRLSQGKDQRDIYIYIYIYIYIEGDAID